MEHSHRPLNHRQERLLKRSILTDGPLDLQQINKILAKHAVLVVLVVQFRHIFQQPRRLPPLLQLPLVLLQFLIMQVVYVEVRGFLRVDLTEIRDGLYGHVDCVLVAERYQSIYLVKNATQNHHVLVVCLVCFFQINSAGVPIHCPQALVLQREGPIRYAFTLGANEHVDNLLKDDPLLLLLVLPVKLIVRCQFFEEPEDAHLYQGVRAGALVSKPFEEQFVDKVVGLGLCCQELLTEAAENEERDVLQLDRLQTLYHLSTKGHVEKYITH